MAGRATVEVEPVTKLEPLPPTHTDVVGPRGLKCPIVEGQIRVPEVTEGPGYAGFMRLSWYEAEMAVYPSAVISETIPVDDLANHAFILLPDRNSLSHALRKAKNPRQTPVSQRHKWQLVSEQVQQLLQENGWQAMAIFSAFDAHTEWQNSADFRTVALMPRREEGRLVGLYQMAHGQVYEPDLPKESTSPPPGAVDIIPLQYQENVRFFAAGEGEAWIDTVGGWKDFCLFKGRLPGDPPVYGEWVVRETIPSVRIYAAIALGAHIELPDGVSNTTANLTTSNDKVCTFLTVKKTGTDVVRSMTTMLDRLLGKQNRKEGEPEKHVNEIRVKYDSDAAIAGVAKFERRINRSVRGRTRGMRPLTRKPVPENGRGMQATPGAPNRDTRAVTVSTGVEDQVIDSPVDPTASERTMAKALRKQMGTNFPKKVLQSHISPPRDGFSEYSNPYSSLLPVDPPDFSGSYVVWTEKVEPFDLQSGYCLRFFTESGAEYTALLLSGPDKEGYTPVLVCKREFADNSQMTEMWIVGTMDIKVQKGLPAEFTEWAQAAAYTDLRDAHFTSVETVRERIEERLRQLQREDPEHWQQVTEVEPFLTDLDLRRQQTDPVDIIQVKLPA